MPSSGIDRSVVSTPNPDAELRARASAWDLPKELVDRGSWTPWRDTLRSVDLLGFRERIPHAERLAQARRRSGVNEALITGPPSPAFVERVRDALDVGLAPRLRLSTEDLLARRRRLHRDAEKLP